MKNGIGIGIIALVGLGAWALSKAKPATAAPFITTLPSTTTLPATSKVTNTEKAAIPLDVWQALTTEQVKSVPVTTEKGSIGVESYSKTSQPVAIGDTGFSIWGMTESGSVVISINDPSTYPIWEWM